MSRALNGVSGVEKVTVDLPNKQAVVVHSGSDIETMKAAVDDAGYEVVGIA